MPARSRSRAGPATLVSLAVLLVLAVAALVVLSAAEAASPQPNCGDTITTDTTLHQNLVNCPNNGIVIGANGITLDLNGHTISGDGMLAVGCNPRKQFCDVGVLNRGHDGVTVRHGSVRQFSVGVWALFVTHNRLLGISSSGNQGAGLGFFRGTRSLMRNCSGSGAAELGMFLGASRHVRILDNSFRNNGELGMNVYFHSTHNLIKGNLVSGNGEFGIILDDADRNQVRHNRSVGDGLTGIVVDLGSQNVIAQNRVSHTRGTGGEDGDGIAVEGGHDHLVVHNVVVDARGAGIRLGVGGRHPFGGHDNVVRGNLVRRSGDDGFLVNKKDRHSLLKRNIATGAGDDGFDINSRTAKLTGNRALRNADLGIEAVAGVIDGGGNIARHNGDPRQCTNIVCG